MAAGTILQILLCGILLFLGLRLMYTSLRTSIYGEELPSWPGLTPFRLQLLAIAVTTSGILLAVHLAPTLQLYFSFPRSEYLDAKLESSLVFDTGKHTWGMNSTLTLRNLATTDSDLELSEKVLARWIADLLKDGWSISEDEKTMNDFSYSPPLFHELTIEERLESFFYDPAEAFFRWRRTQRRFAQAIICRNHAYFSESRSFWHAIHTTTIPLLRQPIRLNAHSELWLDAPEQMVIETFPKAQSSEPLLDSDRRTRKHILLDSFKDDEIAFLRLRIVYPTLWAKIMLQLQWLITNGLIWFFSIIIAVAGIIVTAKLTGIFNRVARWPRPRPTSVGFVDGVQNDKEKTLTSNRPDK